MKMPPYVAANICQKWAAVAIAGDTDVHYGPDDVDITADPQPANAQLRDAAPISYNALRCPALPDIAQLKLPS
jgi:hypothetical protein